jgi:PEP-CTERM motif
MKFFPSVLACLAALGLSAGAAFAGPAAPSNTPEPATFALVGGAAGALILVNRIRKKRNK